MSGAGRFTVHGSVKPDATMFIEHEEKAANAAFSVSDYGSFRISEKEVNREYTVQHTNFKNVCFAVFKYSLIQDRV